MHRAQVARERRRHDVGAVDGPQRHVQRGEGSRRFGDTRRVAVIEMLALDPTEQRRLAGRVDVDRERVSSIGLERLRNPERQSAAATFRMISCSNRIASERL
jgi:hypothetical protein